MKGRVLGWIVGAGIIVAAAGFVLTGPETETPSATDGITPDIARGEQVFWASGCASCHAAEGATGDAMLVLSGGKSLKSDFGTFYAPNITPDPIHGIGGWSDLDLANALRHGVSPQGTFYYPALPYPSYTKMALEDIVSLHAYLMTLPADPAPSRPHDLDFPYTIRRTLGAWNLLFLSSDWVVDGDLTDQERRGRYIVEAMGHCGECHTPRNGLGGPERSRWLGGAPNPAGQGNIPNITPGGLTWTEGEIAEYLKSGFTPDFDTAGGAMVEVIGNTSRLSDDDRSAIAAYLKRVPAVR